MAEQSCFVRNSEGKPHVGRNPEGQTDRPSRLKAVDRVLTAAACSNNQYALLHMQAQRDEIKPRILDDADG